MILTLTNDEVSLVRYACNELANRRSEMAIEAAMERTKEGKEWAEANEKEARAYLSISERLNEQRQTTTMKTFYDATKEQQLTINLWQTRLRESALSFALLPPEKRDPTDLYLMARAFDTVVRDAGLDHLWRMPDHVMSPNTACASSSD